MNIGHSRLLKFLADNSKMEAHSIQIEDLVPTAIESEVPRQQKLREVTTTPEVPEQPARAETAELQNVHTIEWADLRDMVKKPVYVGIQEMVILGPQRIRAPYVSDDDPKTEDKTKPEEKPQTRIPVSRFRPLVERVQREKRKSKEADEEKRKKEAPEKPRRSSIPKLRDRISVARNKSIADDQQTDIPETEGSKETKEDETPDKTKERKPVRREKIPVKSKHHYKITKTVDDVSKSENKDNNTNINADQTPVNVKQEELEDEFDKLYEEIADDNTSSLQDEILETKDPEKLESKFEEIVHQYDKETIEQVKIEPVDKARYSKIPLLRRRSSHDVKVPKQHERRLSLKTGIANKSLGLNSENTNNIKDDMKDNKENSVKDVKVEPTEVTHDYYDQNHSPEINNNEDDYMAAQSPNPIPIYNTIATPESELVKVGLFGISTREIPLENNVNQNEGVATPEPETVKIAAVDLTTIETLLERNNGNESIVEETPNNTKNPQYISEIEDNTSNSTVKDKPEINNATSIETHDIGENTKIEESTKIEEEVITKTADQKEIIKTATIRYDTVLQSEESENSVSQKHLIHTPQDELKSFSLLKKANNVQERTKSRYIIKPAEKEKTNIVNVVTQDEEIPIVKGKVSRILRRLTSHEHSTNGDDDEDIKKEEDIKTKSQHVKVDTIPKKSVLSKIAMFERAEPEQLVPIKQSQTYTKPKRTISEEMRHSPKIVHEVLKPNGTEQTDRYTVVNVDIIKPVEVITNNEEQGTVVEHLQEETIIFDNFEEAKVNKVESIEIEPIETSEDHNETILIDDNRVYNDEANESEVTEQEYTLVNGEITTEQIKIKLNNNRQYEDHSKYDLPERREITEEVFNNVTTEYKPKEHILRDANEPTPLNVQSNKYKPYKNEDKVGKWKSTDALSDFVPVKQKINRLQSYDDNNMKRAKSTAELDLGLVVKGKVKKIIVRMNSFDMLDDGKQKEVVEVINAKERPRKRSVSEKIALFERKLTPVAMESLKIDTGRSLNIDVKPVKNTVNSINSFPDVNLTSSEEYAAKIKELTNAKMTYGRAGDMTYVEFRDGRKMPVLALGTALLEPRLAKHIVAAAIDLGYRAIDTAFIYGNEREVGEGVRAKIRDGTVRREDLFITSKLWSTFHRPDLVEGACRASLAATGLEYFDLYMIHNPMSFKEGSDPVPKIANVIQYSSFDYLDAWFAMEHLVTQGLVRSIGVSNFNAAQLARVLEKGRVKPVVNQVECHPYLSQERLFNFCEARDVRLSCFGVLGSKGTPADLKSTQAAVIDDPLVQVMAAGLGITPAQLLIRYQIDSGHSVVVKASTAAHLWDNLRALSATLAPAQVAALDALNKNKRAFTFKGMGDTHRNYPFKVAF